MIVLSCIGTLYINKRLLVFGKNRLESRLCAVDTLIYHFFQKVLCEQHFPGGIHCVVYVSDPFLSQIPNCESRISSIQAASSQAVQQFDPVFFLVRATDCVSNNCVFLHTNFISTMCQE